MKTTVYVALLFAVQIAACFPAEAQDRSTRKNALQNAKDMTNIIYMDANIPLEEQCCLIPKENIYVHLNENNQYLQHLPFDSKKIAVFPPGAHSFKVSYHDGYKSTLDIDVSSVLEPGKFYTFDYTIYNNMLFPSMVEVTDRDAIENAKKELTSFTHFLEWSQAHLEALEGAYTSKDGQNQVIFTGNKIQTVTYLLNSRIVNDGLFWFDGETILIRGKSMVSGKKQIQQPLVGLEIWYYKLNGDLFEIVDRSGNMLLPMKGEYKKTNLEENQASFTGPTKLEGSYQTQDGKNLLRFTGNTFLLSMPLGYYYEGFFELEEETITLNIRTKGEKQRRRVSKEVLKYTYDEGVLDIVDKSGGISSIVPPNVKNKYYKK